MKKFRLIATSVAFGLVLAIMAFGVYAAVTPAFTISNQILFNPSSEATYFSAEITTYSKATAADEFVELDAVQTVSNADSADGSLEQNKPVTIENFNFNNNVAYKIKIRITNNTDKQMTVAISDVAQHDAIEVSEASAKPYDSYTIEASQSGEVELVYEIVDYTEVINLSQTLKVALSVA